MNCVICGNLLHGRSKISCSDKCREKRLKNKQKEHYERNKHWKNKDPTILKKRKEYNKKIADKKAKYDKDYFTKPENKKRIKHHARVSQYKKLGITIEDYNNMLKKQKNKCGICRAKIHENSYKKLFDVDHNHNTGKVRGLLCNHCNRGLGYLKDNKSYLKNAIKYLEGRWSK